MKNPAKSNNSSLFGVALDNKWLILSAMASIGLQAVLLAFPLFSGIGGAHRFLVIQSLVSTSPFLAIFALGIDRCARGLSPLAESAEFENVKSIAGYLPIIAFAAGAVVGASMSMLTKDSMLAWSFFVASGGAFSTLSIGKEILLASGKVEIVSKISLLLLTTLIVCVACAGLFQCSEDFFALLWGACMLSFGTVFYRLAGLGLKGSLASTAKLAKAMLSRSLRLAAPGLCLAIYSFIDIPLARSVLEERLVLSYVFLSRALFLSYVLSTSLSSKFVPQYAGQLSKSIVAIFFRKLFLFHASISLASMAVIFIAGPYIFEFVFGLKAEWRWPIVASVAMLALGRSASEASSFISTGAGSYLSLPMLISSLLGLAAVFAASASINTQEALIVAMALCWLAPGASSFLLIWFGRD